MTGRSKQMAAVVAGAVVLGSTAYALGSQSGDGTADASRASTAITASAAARGHNPGEHLAALARRLGVSTAKLQAALDDLRRNPPAAADPRTAIVKALGDALGLSQAKVNAALDQARARHERQEKAVRDAFATAVAKELGVDAGKVKAAFDKARPHGPRRAGPRRDPVATIADALGVSEARLRAALRAAGTTVGRPHPGFGRFEADLADALGVSTARLRHALAQVRAAALKQERARRPAFARALAATLSLPVQKVQDALLAGPFGDRHDGPGWHRRGPGGPDRPHWG